MWFFKNSNRYSQDIIKKRPLLVAFMAKTFKSFVWIFPRLSPTNVVFVMDFQSNKRHVMEVARFATDLARTTIVAFSVRQLNNFRTPPKPFWHFEKLGVRFGSLDHDRSVPI